MQPPSPDVYQNREEGKLQMQDKTLKKGLGLSRSVL